MKKRKIEKPLTLTGLENYTPKTLLPAIKRRFRADTYFQEMLMLSHKVDRHEKWIQEIAEKIGVKLTI